MNGLLPLLDIETGHPLELAKIAGRQAKTMRKAGGGQPRVANANHLALLRKIGPQLRVGSCNRQIDWQNRDGRKYAFDEG